MIMRELFDSWQRDKYGHNNVALRHRRIVEVYKGRGIQRLCGRCGKGCKVLAGEGWTTFKCYDYNTIIGRKHEEQD